MPKPAAPKTAFPRVPTTAVPTTAAPSKTTNAAPDRSWRLFVLAVHEEATATAAAKGLRGTLAQVATLQEAASLVSAHAGRAVGQQEVLRIVLNERRARRLRNALPETLAQRTEADAAPPAAVARGGSRLRRGRIAALAARPGARGVPAALG